MRDPILVPGHRTALPRLLDKDRVVVGDKIIAIDGSGDGQELGMTVEAQATRHGLAHARHEKHDLGGSLIDEGRLGHFDGMAAAEGGGPAPGSTRGRIREKTGRANSWP